MPTESAAARDRLIVALDFPDAVSALRLVDSLEGRCCWFKVGLELFLTAGPAIVEKLRSRDFNIFLDLKLHDIPNTVAGAVRAIAPLGASLLTVHAAGGAAMLQAAAEAAAVTSTPPRLLAVTVLTSMDAAQLAETGLFGSVADQVQRLAQLSLANGMDGVVCSSREVAQLRAAIGESPLVIVPGIRPAGSATNDQTRIATPADAIAAGASKLVIGRPITRSADPATVFEAIVSSIDLRHMPAVGVSPTDRLTAAQGS